MKGTAVAPRTRSVTSHETVRDSGCSTDKEVCIMCVSAWLLLSFFWAFWVFAFGGWWCGGIC